MDKTAILKAMAAILNAVTETVKEAGPLGTPAGTIYAALSAQGCSKAQFDQVMQALVTAGRLRRDGCLYFAV